MGSISIVVVVNQSLSGSGWADNLASNLLDQLL